MRMIPEEQAPAPALFQYLFLMFRFALVAPYPARNTHKPQADIHSSYRGFKGLSHNRLSPPRRAELKQNG
jgi:hypothetical protein